MAISSSGIVSYSNIYSQTYGNLFNLINSRSNVPDPNDSSGRRKFVYQREPKVTGRNFEGYPFIVIPLNGVGKSKGTLKTKGRTNFSFEILVYSKDNSSDTSGDPSGAQTLNTISNNLFQVLNDSTNKFTLRNYGMKNLEVTDSPADWDELEGEEVFFRAFTLNFSQMLSVSA